MSEQTAREIAADAFPWDEANFPCSRCGARVGDPCVTTSGARAAAPHSPRTRPANEVWRQYHPRQVAQFMGKGFYAPMPESDGGADFALVKIATDGKPRCMKHGAMNKVSELFWRCITTSGPKHNPCRAGCQEPEPLFRKVPVAEEETDE